MLVTPSIFFCRIVRTEALVYNSYIYFFSTAVIRKLFNIIFSYKHGSPTRQDQAFSLPTIQLSLASVAGAKRGQEGEGEKCESFSPQSPSLFPFLPIPYPFRRLLRRLIVFLEQPVPTKLCQTFSHKSSALFLANISLDDLR